MHIILSFPAYNNDIIYLTLQSNTALLGCFFYFPLLSFVFVQFVFLIFVYNFPVSLFPLLGCKIEVSFMNIHIYFAFFSIYHYHFYLLAEECHHPTHPEIG